MARQAKQKAAPGSVHTLLIPTQHTSLLVPSATIAEVINPVNLIRQPYSPAWCVGLIGWRAHAVPIISLEILEGKPAPTPGPRSKYVIFFPFPGCNPWEFFGILSSAEPQPHTIVDTSEMRTETPKLPYAASALNMNNNIAVIPDMAKLKAAFFPLA